MMPVFTIISRLAAERNALKEELSRCQRRRHRESLAEESEDSTNPRFVRVRVPPTSAEPDEDTDAP